MILNIIVGCLGAVMFFMLGSYDQFLDTLPASNENRKYETYVMWFFGISLTEFIIIIGLIALGN